MARALSSFAVSVLLAAFVLQLITSISLPVLTDLDIVRIHFNQGNVSINGIRPVSQLKLGIWGYCTDKQGSDTSCDHTGHGYSLAMGGPINSQVETIDSSWTNGLAVHPVATGVILVALLLSFSTHLFVSLIASLVSFLAGLITIIAFAIDIALFALAKHAVNDVQGVSATTRFGPGFWVTLATIILLLIGGCTVCFGRHRARRGPEPTNGKESAAVNGEKQGPFWRRFGRNKA